MDSRFPVPLISLIMQWHACMCLYNIAAWRRCDGRGRRLVEPGANSCCSAMARLRRRPRIFSSLHSIRVSQSQYLSELSIAISGVVG